MTTMLRKHARRIPEGNHQTTIPLPIQSRELWPATEGLHMMETLHTPGSYLWNPAFAGHPLATQPWAQSMEGRQGCWCPPVNVRDTDNEVVLEVYLPGVNKGDIRVDVRNGSLLVIQGERNPQRSEREEEPFLRREFFFKNFYRCFALPLEVKAEGITSRYSNGILEVCLIKGPEAKLHTYRVMVQA